MTGKSHTDPSATPFALSIMQKMNDKCKEWKTAENIDYSLYGTPPGERCWNCASNLSLVNASIFSVTWTW